MSLTVQVFTCPKCNRGEFRSLPGPDGKAFCPWCGDGVAGGIAPPTPAPPAPEPVASTAPALVSETRVVDDGPLRERVAELTRRCEQAEGELQRELDKKQQIKQAVALEMKRLEAVAAESRTLLLRKEEEQRTAVAGLARLETELQAERRKVEDLSGTRMLVEGMEKTVHRLEAENVELREGRDAATKEAEHLKSDLAKAEGERGELRKKLAAAEARVETLKDAAVELSDLKAERRRLEKERAEFQVKAAALQSEVEKRDRRVAELQMLVKTLGERLNDLTRRLHV